MSNMKEWYADKGEAAKFQQINNRWKAKYRKKTGAFMYEARSWDEFEDRLVLSHAIPDRELSKKIRRSVTAIQIRRNRLKRGNKCTGE